MKAISISLEQMFRIIFTRNKGVKSVRFVYYLPLAYDGDSDFENLLAIPQLVIPVPWSVVSKEGFDACNYALKHHEIDFNYLHSQRVIDAKIIFEVPIEDINSPRFSLSNLANKSGIPYIALGITSLVQRPFELAHLWMMDFEAEIGGISVTLDMVEKWVRETGESGYIVETDNAWHFYSSKTLLKPSVWRLGMENAKNFPVIGKRYPHHQLQVGFGVLRVSSCIVEISKLKDAPFVVGTVGIADENQTELF